MSIGITRRVARLAFLLFIASVAVVGYTLAGITTLLGTMGAAPPLVVLGFVVPVLFISSQLAAFYLHHAGSPAWREAPDGP